MELSKAEESLKTAELCYSQGLYNSSASRAYYAMFQAAQVALEAAGFARSEWSHAGLHATFANELTRRRKQYAAALARDLTIVQELRHTADYRNYDLSERQAARALHKAREFVNTIKGRISHG
ncbi:MAG: HEPN domain-containing protein [Candidatus Binatia bacterium]